MFNIKNKKEKRDQFSKNNQHYPTISKVGN